MSYQENNNAPKNDEQESDVKSTQGLDEGSTDNASEQNEVVSQGLRKPRGIGFLGRRGTAPIKTTASANDGVKTDEQAKSGDKKPEPKKTVILGPSEKAFTYISKFSVVAWLFLIFLLVLHSASSIWLPSVFFSQELNLLEVYSDMQGLGQWLIPPATEHIQLSFPVYYWFMSLVDLIPFTDTIFLPLLAVLTAFLALSGVFALGLCTGLGTRVSLAAALIMLASPSFASLSHMLSPELFSAGLLAFALALLCRAWISDSAPLSFVFGFFFLVLACLSAGFLPLWTVLISSLLFIIWRGTFGRANKLDAVLGFGVLVLSFAALLIFIIIGGGPQAEALNQIMKQIVAPFMPPYWPLNSKWYYGLILLALGCAPWILLPIFASWLNVLKNTLANIKASRKENSGTTWLYISFVVGCILLVRSGETPAAILLYPILFVLLAKTLCNLSALGSNMFFGFVAFLALVAGFLCIGLSIQSTASLLLGLIPASYANILQNIQGLDVAGGILLLMAIVLIRFTKRSSPCGSLLVLSLFMVLLTQPFTMLTAPSLIDKGAKYHALGSGMGVLPYGLGAPAPVIVPVEESPQNQPQATPIPEVTLEAPAPAVPLSTEPNPSSVPNVPTISIPDASAPEPSAPEPSAPEPSVPESTDSVQPVIPDDVQVPAITEQSQEPIQELPTANETDSL